MKNFKSYHNLQGIDLKECARKDKVGAEKNKKVRS